MIPPSAFDAAAPPPPHHGAPSGEPGAGGEQRLNVCIVHDSSIVKHIIRDYIRADHPDADVFLAAPSPDLPAHLTATKYDIVFSGLEMERLDVSDVQSALAGSEVNAMTPLVVMTATDGEALRQRLSRRGVRHILPLPCTSTAFRRLIYRIFNPDSNRVHRMYYTPNSRACIEMEGGCVDAAVVHVGRDAVACEMPALAAAGLPTLAGTDPISSKPADENAGEGQVAPRRLVRLHFPADYGRASAIEVTAGILGVKEAIPAPDPERIQIFFRVRWQAFELHAATRRSIRLRLTDPAAFAAMEGEQDADRETTAPEDAASGEDLRFLARRNDELADRNAALQSELDGQIMENERLIRKIHRLNEQIRRVESASSPDEAARLASLGALINEKPNPSKDPARLAIFRQVIKDNIKLRES